MSDKNKTLSEETPKPQDKNNTPAQGDGENSSDPKTELLNDTITEENSSDPKTELLNDTVMETPADNSKTKKEAAIAPGGKTIKETPIVPGDKTKKEAIPTPKAYEPTPEPRKNTILYALIVLLVITLSALVYFAFFKNKSQDNINSNVKHMQEMAQDIQGMEETVKAKQDEVFDMVKDYKEKTGDDSLGGINPLNLDEREKALLEEKIKNEKDISKKALLKEINDKNDEILELQEKIKKIEELLPRPHLVKQGDNHYKIALDFLVNEKGVTQKEAAKLVERTALIEPLVPGFKVWNFYSGNVYGTSVTQGSADVSPNTLIRNAKKKLVDARDQAVTEKEKLAGDITVLEEKRTKLVSQVGHLNTEKENLITKVTDLNVQNEEMQETVNSLFYLLDKQRNLKKEGIIKGGFLKSTKLKKIAPEYFTKSLDLRTSDKIAVSAADLDIAKIKSLTLYPKFYKKGVDYKVEVDPDKKNAYITFVSVTKFKNERVVIAVK
ncbi:MAG: hypothetical protein GY765_11015 [bacterium]|nr:hypothetical protein [bacterium]